VATLVTDKLTTLDAQRARLEEERSEILARQTSWQAAQSRIAGVKAWCQRVARNFDRLSYAEKRDALTALDVRVVLQKAGQAPG
jgi:hypothetical protein